jgi:hypothetical protein
MAWSSAALASYETTRLAADKPLVASQAIPISPSTAIWSDAGLVASPDRTNSSYPIIRAYDEFVGLDTRADATVSSIWYLVLDLGALTEFDCLFLIGHNFSTLTTITFEIADDAAFAGNLQQIASITPATGRLQEIDLNNGGAAQRYQAQYVRLKLVDGGAFTPQLTELILGRRRQLEFCPNRPFNRYALRNETDALTTQGGVTHKTVYYRNQYVLNANSIMDNADSVSDWVAFFQAVRGSFVWVLEPNSAPGSWHMISREPDELDMELVSPPSTYRVNLGGFEQGPESYFLANE